MLLHVLQSGPVKRLPVACNECTIILSEDSWTHGVHLLSLDCPACFEYPSFHLGNPHTGGPRLPGYKPTFSQAPSQVGAWMTLPVPRAENLT